MWLLNTFLSNQFTINIPATIENIVIPTWATPSTNPSIITQLLFVIEWPELITTPLKNKLEIYIDYRKKKNEREIKMIGFGKWKKFENEF